jgi:hypothetical protein
MLLYHELENLWSETDVICFQVQSKHFPLETELNDV